MAGGRISNGAEITPLPLGAPVSRTTFEDVNCILKPLFEEPKIGLIKDPFSKNVSDSPVSPAGLLLLGNAHALECGFMH